jgi:hypothetical protein
MTFDHQSKVTRPLSKQQKNAHRSSSMGRLAASLNNSPSGKRSLMITVVCKRSRLEKGEWWDATN